MQGHGGMTELPSRQADVSHIDQKRACVLWVASIFTPGKEEVYVFSWNCIASIWLSFPAILTKEEGY